MTRFRDGLAAYAAKRCVIMRGMYRRRLALRTLLAPTNNRLESGDVISRGDSLEPFVEQ